MKTDTFQNLPENNAEWHKVRGTKFYIRLWLLNTVFINEYIHFTTIRRKMFVKLTPILIASKVSKSAF